MDPRTRREVEESLGTAEANLERVLTLLNQHAKGIVPVAGGKAGEAPKKSVAAS